mgnify:CR=1 FL=1
MAAVAGKRLLLPRTSEDWAVIRPPLQSPDEPQHLMKANSVWLQPWLNEVPDLNPADNVVQIAVTAED